MEKADIDRLFKGRRITEEYEHGDQGKDTTWDFIRRLQGIGFNSPKQFYVWNDKMNKQAYKECVPIIGECDHCKGCEGEPPCYQLFTPGSPLYIFPCYEDIPGEEKFKKHMADFDGFFTFDNLIEITFLLIKAGYAHVGDKSNSHGLGVCPPEHGFHADLENMKDLPFDVNWYRRY